MTGFLQPRQGLWCGSLSHPASVLASCDITPALQAILNTPLLSGQFE